MDITLTSHHLHKDPVASRLVTLLRNNAQHFGLENALLYYDFPLYKDESDTMLSAKVLLISPKHGVIIFGTPSVLSRAALADASNRLEQVTSAVYSRLLKAKALRRTPTQVSIPVLAVLYAPSVDAGDETYAADVLTSDRQVEALFDEENMVTLSPDVVREVSSTIDGARGLLRAPKRDIQGLPSSSKGALASQLETAIVAFDAQQREGSLLVVTGPQRIRGLAGSGKTIILAMKAALAHLREPDALILYTFYTKSLYQHIQRLITRFYRQFDDRDPDWDRIKIMHAWGGRNLPGVYYTAALKHEHLPVSFQDAARAKPGAEFDYACSTLMGAVDIVPMYDYVFADEGQDYPASFLQLAYRLARDGRFVYAYDELQTIFQRTAASPHEIFGVDANGEANVEVHDTVLHKCYRNPREVIVCGHALGFGLYGDSIVQMLENEDHWEDVGYKVIEGALKAGERVVIERPKSNSLTLLSDAAGIDDLIQTSLFNSLDEEVEGVVKSIEADIGQGLRPEDILVVSVDDRNARSYFSALAASLVKRRIGVNDIHQPMYGFPEFITEGCVTLSTVHKAKGNEAFMVYVVGIDAIFSEPDVRRRNMLYTAISRAKGWLRLSGVGAAAQRGAREVATAKGNFPNLIFEYPNEEQLKIMERDLEEASSRQIRLMRLIEELTADASPDEIQALMARAGTSRDRGKKTRGKK